MGVWEAPELGKLLALRLAWCQPDWHCPGHPAAARKSLACPSPLPHTFCSLAVGPACALQYVPYSVCHTACPAVLPYNSAYLRPAAHWRRPYGLNYSNLFSGRHPRGPRLLAARRDPVRLPAPHRLGQPGGWVHHRGTAPGGHWRAPGLPAQPVSGAGGAAPQRRVQQWKLGPLLAEEGSRGGGGGLICCSCSPGRSCAHGGGGSLTQSAMLRHGALR